MNISRYQDHLRRGRAAAALFSLVAATSTACSAKSGGEAIGRTVAHAVAGDYGVDYAWSQPSPQALVNGGYTFAARYLSYDSSKDLSPGEARALMAAGIDIVANWEAGAEDALAGYSTGYSEAQTALQIATACGMPAGRPIYFSVDFDASPGQQAAIDDYFQGAADALGGVQHVGAYGGYYVIQRLFDHGKIAYGWQTYAWSGGQWDPRAQLRQVNNDQTVGGADVDVDQAQKNDFGQWGPGAPSTTPAAAPAPEGSQAFVYPNQQHFFDNDGQGNIRHHWYDGATRQITTDDWGNGILGQPVTFVDGTSQHIFARDGGGALQHWYWDPVNGNGHDTWAPSGIAGDPAAIMIGDFQDVWAVDGGHDLQHWWWGPNSGRQQDSSPWATGVQGRPSVLLYENGEQHVFVRTYPGSTLAHAWWSPSDGMHQGPWGSGVLIGDPASLAIGDFQDVWFVDSGNNLQQAYWGPNTGGLQQVQWGTGVVGRPSVLLAGGQQHAFVRGQDGSLQHWWWDPQAGLLHDDWTANTPGITIAEDPTALLVGTQQHVWALDAAHHVQHWYWDPANPNVVNHDDWGQ